MNPPSKIFALLRTRKEKAVVLVGHEPNLSNFLSAALAGEHARIKIEFKKGGAACVEFAQAHRTRPGHAALDAAAARAARATLVARNSS